MKNLFCISVFLLSFSPGICPASERQGNVEMTVNITAPEESRDVRVWIPYPASNDTQDITDIKVDGNYSRSGIYREKETGNLALYANWEEPEKHRVITLTFNARAEELVRRDFPDEEQLIPPEIQQYLRSTDYIPTDGVVREIATSITGDGQRISEKARAVYRWVVANTTRHPDVIGCGTGEVEKVLAKRGGKCADISSVFVSIARAAGVPAREVFGLRLGKKDIQDMTSGHHCWAEFYVPGYGWVPADPADVRKAMLTDALELDQARDHLEYFFGAVEQYRISLARGGRGYFLNPPQNEGPLNYFMYPYAEVDGKALEWLAAQKNLKYSIKFKAL